MDVRYHVTDPHPVREVLEEGSLPCPRSQLRHPADILSEAHAAPTAHRDPGLVHPASRVFVQFTQNFSPE